MDKPICFVLNFGHPVRQDALDQIPKPYEILNIPCQLRMESNRSMAPIDVKFAINRAAKLMERYDAKLDGTSPVVAVLPSINDAAALLLAMLHGRLGQFPRIMVFRRDQNSMYKLVENVVSCRTCHGRGNVKTNEQKCPACTGIGYFKDTTKSAVIQCKYCEGTGMFHKGANKCMFCSGKGWVQNDRIICDDCKGKGIFFDTETCPNCSGTGVMSIGMLLDLNIVRNSAREQGRRELSTNAEKDDEI